MMTDPHEPLDGADLGPLAGVLAVDATDASGAYCGRLLADLGADVVRLEPRAGDPLRSHPPTARAPSGQVVSCFERFVNLNKRSLAVDLSRPEGREVVRRLVQRCDVLIDTPGLDGSTVHGLEQGELDLLHPQLVRVSITAYGVAGPYAGLASDDLTTIASGGLLSLAGYEDTSPVAPCGEQSFFARSIFAACGAVLALLARSSDGRGRRVDVSGQEAMACALEDAFPDYDFNGVVRRRAGDRPREAGTGTFRCADGYVTIVAGRLGTAPAWAALVEWINDERVPGAELLRESRWSEHSYRQSPEAVRVFKEIFERFAAVYSKGELYRQAQQRKIALAPMNDFTEVLKDPQLTERGFFQHVEDPLVGSELIYPGRPYRIDGLPPLVRRPAPGPGEHNQEILAELLGVGTEEMCGLAAPEVV